MRGTEILFPALLVWFVLGMSAATTAEVVPKLPGVPNHFEILVDGSESSWKQRIVRSPSGYVVRKAGAWSADRKARRKRKLPSNNRRIWRTENWSAGAQPMSEEAQLAIDGSVETRWRTGRPQRPGDKFELSLGESQEVLQVVLSVRETPSDFPRGIHVEGSVDGVEYFTIVNHPVWNGPVQWTERGYPYFGAQSKVIIDFPKPFSVQHLRFTQLGKAERWDWSIGEAKLYGIKGTVKGDSPQ